MEMTYKLDTFEGPLDLLLHLIDEAEIDIYDIPISQITDQYLAYLSAMNQLELELTSEFLVMASTLLKIKSQMLLPKIPKVHEGEEEEEDPRAALVERLIEYRKYKEAADHFRHRELERSKIYTRGPLDLTPYLPTTIENPLRGVHIADLVFAFQKTIKRAKKRNAVSKIERDEISVKDLMNDILTVLQENNGKILFSRIFNKEMNREEIVVTFLAILELMKRKLIYCYQYALFEEIVVQLRKGVNPDGEFTDEIHY